MLIEIIQKEVLGVFAKLRKATIGLDMSVSVTVSRPYGRTRLSPNGFHEI